MGVRIVIAEIGWASVGGDMSGNAPAGADEDGKCYPSFEDGVKTTPAKLTTPAKYRAIVTHGAPRVESRDCGYGDQTRLHLLPDLCRRWC